MSEVTPAQAVEAAAAAAERVHAGWGTWDDIARAALEAAAPHMLAGAWDDDDEAWDSNRVAIGANPFRPTP